MSGCVEGILVDLAEPEQEEENTGNFLINPSESLEVVRAEQTDRRKSFTITSPLVASDKILPDVTDTFNKSNDNHDTSVLVTLDDEIFDFDLPVTPVTSSDRSATTEDEAEEEVFFGPVRYVERCVATAVSSVSKEVKPLSPLNDRQMAEICKEANAVAARIAAAAGQKRNKRNQKEVLCSKQLNMDKTPCIFSPKAVGKLLKAVSSRTDNSEDKENEMEVEVDSIGDIDKQVCDTDGVTSKLTSSNDIPLLDISGMAEIVNEHKCGSSSEEEGKVKININGEEQGDKHDDSEEMTPSRRHNRSGTYTVSKVPHEKLPAAKRKSLPVVSHSTSAKKELNITENLTVKPNSTGKRSLDVPCNADSEKKSGSKLKRSLSKLVKPKTHIPAAPAVNQPSIKPPSPEEETLQTKPKSRLSAPKAGLVGKERSLLPSKLKAPGTAATSATSTGIPSKTGSHLPQKSAIPGLKGKPAGNGSGKPAPMSKLQLMKPGAIQKSSLTANQNKAPSALKKPGPMKAFVPVSTNQENVPDVSTPAKEEKCIQPKNLLSSKFGTPQKSGSTSSTDTPASVQKRRSFLPTPGKSRTGSTGSVPSPCPGRNNSVFSNSSRGSSLTDSPSLNDSVSKPRQRKPSGSKSTGKYSYLDNLNDQSPSAMKPQRQLVTNTPNMPRKKISPWSPVSRKKPMDPEDQAFMCTKKMKR